MRPTDAAPALRETLATYDATAPAYAARWNDHAMSDPLRAFLARVPAPQRVVDLGCGTGRDAAALTAAGARVIGVDASAGMLRQARLLHHALVQGDLRCLPLADQCADGVWACASLVHLRRVELAPAATEIARLLTVGGVVHLSVKTAAADGWQVTAGRRRWFTYFTAAELEQALTTAGLHVQDTDVQVDDRGVHWLNVAAVRST